MVTSNNPLPVAGINKRGGRPKKWLTYSFDKCAESGFALAGAYIKDVTVAWNGLTLEQKADAVSKILPIALKRIPDKHEVMQITLNASDADMQKLLAIADRNSLVRNELDMDSHTVKLTPIESENGGTGG